MTMDDVKNAFEADVIGTLTMLKTKKFAPSSDDIEVPIFEANTQYIVTDAEEFEAAAETVRGLKKLLKKVEAHYSTITRAIDGVKSLVLKMKRCHTDPIERAISVIDTAAIAWKTETDRREAEEKRKAELAAQQKAEAEKIAAAAALKQQAKAIADPVMKKALNAEAKATLAMPAIPERVNYASSIPMVQGYATTTRYSAELMNLDTLVKAIVDGKVPLQAVQFNQTFANQTATQQKEAMNWPGVKVIKKTGSSTR